jgi:hypothetical protein
VVAGINLGDSTPHGLQIGAEVSLVTALDRGQGWLPLGVYADYVHSKGTNRISCGPEVLFLFEPHGWHMTLILDGGYAATFRAERRYDGLAARATVMVMPVPVLPYFRYERVQGIGNVFEGGLLIKFPIGLGAGDFNVIHG